ncbi:hypothetical protein AYI70_g1857 [Smittium culicis]|uniref:Uncharacterized protein n=1 Tax=Smittium culicis TaxID=133412 RepID=A0A1R1YBI6_9FUNG|nr:hypothetical protein AYI70_g1857 [Smittium culicis]
MNFFPTSTKLSQTRKSSKFQFAISRCSWDRTSIWDTVRFSGPHEHLIEAQFFVNAPHGDVISDLGNPEDLIGQ